MGDYSNAQINPQRFKFTKQRNTEKVRTILYCRGRSCVVVLRTLSYYSWQKLELCFSGFYNSRYISPGRSWILILQNSMIYNITRGRSRWNIPPRNWSKMFSPSGPLKEVQEDQTCHWPLEGRRKEEEGGTVKMSEREGTQEKSMRKEMRDGREGNGVRGMKTEGEKKK